MKPQGRVDKELWKWSQLVLKGLRDILDHLLSRSFLLILFLFFPCQHLPSSTSSRLRGCRIPSTL